MDIIKIAFLLFYAFSIDKYALELRLGFIIHSYFFLPFSSDSCCFYLGLGLLLELAILICLS